MAGEQQGIVTAGLVIIGNEILSGRTLDTNTQHIAQKLGEKGVRLAEVRVVPDAQEQIVCAVNALRGAHGYVFTTGGIGPTHDDITAESVAAAFEVALIENAEALQILEGYYGARGETVTPARAKMTMIPQGASLIPNPVSGAPGFVLGNVYVMAGVPKIMQAMLDHVIDSLEGGAVVHSRSLEAGLPESRIAAALGTLQDECPDVDIGSYPNMKGGRWGAAIVLRSTDRQRLEETAGRLEAVLAALRAQETR